MAYLAHATIWKDPGDLSPDEILAGPSDLFPYSAAEALQGIPCTFAQRGRELGGKSAKFLCSTGEGRTLRLKYWDRERDRGNREVFAMVAAQVVMGLGPGPWLPASVAAARPTAGGGAGHARAGRMGMPGGPRIRSRDDRDQGWSWRELDQAIKAQPPGPERTRQRTHFDALTLLGVFVQHGDRKPEQQMLYCDGPVDITAGEISKGRDAASILLERPGSSACRQPAVVVVDVGATFGGAGRTSSNETAKMDVDAWRSKTIFQEGDRGACRARADGFACSRPRR
jgi:hypothetical protein